MSKTVSVKQTSALGSQCMKCKLWFAFVHPASDGSFQCRACLELSGNNRSASPGYFIHGGGRVVTRRT